MYRSAEMTSVAFHSDRGWRGLETAGGDGQERVWFQASVADTPPGERGLPVGWVGGAGDAAETCGTSNGRPGRTKKGMRAAAARFFVIPATWSCVFSIYKESGESESSYKISSKSNGSDGLVIIYQTNVTSTSTTTEKLFYGDGLLLAKTVNYTAYYIHDDALGSVRMEATSAVDVVFSSDYQPFGPGWSTTGREEFMYAGEPYDSATGFYLFGARYYDPSMGRFVTEDQYMGNLADPSSLDRYVYAEDNPEVYKDPTGHVAIAAYAGGGEYNPTSTTGKMNFATWVVADFIETKVVEIAGDVVSAFLVPLDPFLAYDDTHLVTATASVISSALSDGKIASSLGNAILNGDYSGAATSILGLVPSIILTYVNSINLLDKVLFVASIGGYQGIDALTGSTADEIGWALGTTVFALDMVSLYYQALSSYSSYLSSLS
jgi:RHS repeat-associated protein